MPGQYPNRIKQLPLFDGRFDAYKLEAKDSTVLFASYPAGTSIPPHSHDTDNHYSYRKPSLPRGTRPFSRPLD